MKVWLLELNGGIGGSGIYSSKEKALEEYKKSFSEEFTLEEIVKELADTGVVEEYNDYLSEYSLDEAVEV